MRKTRVNGHFTKAELLESVKKVAGCWEWQGTLSRGYGSARRHGRTWQIHRVAKFLWDDMPFEVFMDTKTYHACHKCDNRKCINPAHIFMGTRQENIDDCVQKGRHQRGEKNNLTNFVTADIRDIHWFFNQGFTHAAIAEIYGVWQSTITNIINRKNWKHVQLPKQ